MPTAKREINIIGLAIVVKCRILHKKPTTSREMAILKGVLKIFFSVSIELFLRFSAFQPNKTEMPFCPYLKRHFPMPTLTKGP
jgi:hypothetical protein